MVTFTEPVALVKELPSTTYLTVCVDGGEPEEAAFPASLEDVLNRYPKFVHRK